MCLTPLRFMVLLEDPFLSLIFYSTPNKAKQVVHTVLCHPSRTCSSIIPVWHFQNQCLYFVSYYSAVFQYSKSLDLGVAQADEVIRTKPFQALTAQPSTQKHATFPGAIATSPSLRLMLLQHTLSSITELLLTLKSSLYFLEYISDSPFAFFYPFKVYACATELHELLCPREPASDCFVLWAYVSFAVLSPSQIDTCPGFLPL